MPGQGAQSPGLLVAVWSLGPPRAGSFFLPLLVVLMMTRAAVVAEVVDGMWVLRAVVVVDVDVDKSLVACCLSPWLGGCCVPSYRN